MRIFWMMAAIAMVAAAQEASDTPGWTGMGEGATVTVENGRAELRYEIAANRLSGMVTVPPASFASMRRLRFRVKPDHATAMGVVLSERTPGGGNYIAWFWARQGDWQEIELTPADFTVSDAANEPADADGKLDLDEVEAIGIFDLTQFFATLKARGPVPVVIDDASGAHTVAVDRFEVLSDVGSRTAGRSGLHWVTPGGMDLKWSEGANPLGGGAMEASYKQRSGEVELLMRREPGGEAASATNLAFDIASENEATLILSLEMKKAGGGEGPHYTLPIFAPGGRERFHVDLKLENFQGPADAPKFDPAKWRTTALIDVTNAAGSTPASNTLWIGDFHVTTQ